MIVNINRLWSFAANPRVRTALILFAVSLAGSTLGSLFPGPSGFPFLITALLTIFVGVITVTLGIGFAIFGRQWRVVGERLTLLVFSLPIIIAGSQLGDYVHLAILYPYYSQKISQTSKRPVNFSWGDEAVTVLDGFQMRTLLYDDTGATTVTSDEKPNEEGLCTIRSRLFMSFFIQLEKGPC